jgi:outer membrane lipoprotein LolB
MSIYRQCNLRLDLLIILSLCLSACSSLPPEHPALTWEQRQLQLQQVIRYQARGRLIYQTPERSFTARFKWHQSAPDRLQWRLTHPLGQTLFLLKQQGGTVSLQDHLGQYYQGDQAEQFLRRQSGFVLPLSLLARWLIGLPTPYDQYQLDGQQRLKQLIHSDSFPIQLNYLAYRDQESLSLPTQLQLEIGVHRLLLTIDYWTLP